MMCSHFLIIIFLNSFVSCFVYEPHYCDVYSTELLRYDIFGLIIPAVIAAFQSRMSGVCYLTSFCFFKCVFAVLEDLCLLKVRIWDVDNRK